MGNFGLSDGKSTVRKPVFTVFMAKTLVYFLRFFALQRTPKSVRGDLDPKIQKINISGQSNQTRRKRGERLLFTGDTIYLKRKSIKIYKNIAKGIDKSLARCYNVEKYQGGSHNELRKNNIGVAGSY